MGEVMNVMYFEHDGSMFFENSNEESVKVHGISPSHMVQLMRNLVDSKMALNQLPKSSVNDLGECMDRLNEMFEGFDWRKQ